MVRKIKRQAIIIFTSLIICASLIVGILHNSFNVKTYADGDSGNSECVYLSDINYADGSNTGWPAQGIRYDKAVNDKKISLKIEGVWYVFDKGVFATATSTVIYDISSYNYNYFTAYIGIDSGNVKSGNGAKFYVYTSVDGTNWSLATSDEPEAKLPNGDAEFLFADISGAKYLKLYADNLGDTGGDLTVWADAKLTNSVYGDDDVKPLSYYDEQIKDKAVSADLNDESLELLVLQREFVRKVGQYALKKFSGESADNKLVLEWLLNDVDNLREFMLGGDPMMGNWFNSLTVLSNLYRNYKTDLDNDEFVNNIWQPDRNYGQLYRTMMFSIALTHDGVVGAWMQKARVENQSDPLRRYAIYRYMIETERFVATRNADGTPKYDTTPWFTSLRVEEMRYIMFNIIDDESILWLNDYVQTRINANPGNAGGLHTPHSYIAYTDPNYNNPVYYAEENRDYFNDLFAVDDRDNPGEKIGMWDTEYKIRGGVDSPTYTLTVTRGTTTDKLQKVWMNFRNKFGTGSVCGGISKSGCNIRGVRGVPASVIGQPGHAAILAYGKNADGKGYWTIDNNVGGWTVATKSERHMLGWGNAAWQRTIYGTVVYFHLAQDAVNDYDNLVKAEEYVMLAKVYDGNLTKQEELYEKALTAQPINLDAWYGLVQTYNANDDKTEQNCFDLAERIVDTMVGYPLPTHHLLEVVKTKLTSTEFAYKHILLAKQALTASSVLPNTATDKTLMPSAARDEAKYILGRSDTSVATFSFDGENAGCIVWAERFDNTGIRWKYSLDGKQTWKSVYFTAEEPHILQLSEQELANVTEDNDIYIHIEGVPENDENYYKIDITSKPSLPNTLYLNDMENRVIGVDNTYEWRYPGDTNWTSYSEAAPDCSGNKTIEVRIKASGGKPFSDSKIFAFTADTDTDTRKYITVDHLSLEGYSSQSQDKKRPNYATNAIDGNGNTYWHTDYGKSVKDGTDVVPYLIIKLDTPRYVSGLEYVQYQYTTKFSIFAKTVKVYVSEDNEKWTEVGKLENIEATDDLRVVNFDKTVYGQYVKLVLEELYETNSLDGVFATVSMVNLYEDTTKAGNSTPGSNNPGTPVVNNPVTPGGDNQNTPGGNNQNTPGGNNQNTPGGNNQNAPGASSDGDNTNGSKDGKDSTIWIILGVSIGLVVVAGAGLGVVIFIKRKNR